jgi:hypothetical protein
MSIDGISRGGPAAPPVSAESVSGVAEVAKPFSLEAAQQVGEHTGSDALGRLERGEINFEQYLDLHTADALRHLEGKLPRAERAFIEAELRAELESDPVLLELVRRATGMSRVG